MVRCSYEACPWQSIAPSDSAAQKQLAKHVVERHGVQVDADVPDGKVQVRFADDGEWQTVTAAEAKRLHEERHDD